jgi:ABC-type multidrug transport system fused ATPase/permease subunit
LIDGHEIRDVDVASLRARVAVVQQDAPLMDLTIRENIAYGRPDADMEDVVHAARLAQADEFIRRLPQGWVRFLKMISVGSKRWMKEVQSGAVHAVVFFADPPTLCLPATEP